MIFASTLYLSIEPTLKNTDSNSPNVDWAKVTLSTLICAAGLFGNLLTIFIIILLKEYRKSITHWLV